MCCRREGKYCRREGKYRRREGKYCRREGTTGRREGIFLKYCRREVTAGEASQPQAICSGRFQELGAAFALCDLSDAPAFCD